MATSPVKSPTRDEESWKAQDEADALDIQKILASTENGEGIGITLTDTPFDQTNKADDAQDFEDISDDDLPDEEEATAPNSLSVPGLTDDGGTSNDTDDLFGEGDGPSSPIDPPPGPSSPGAHIHDPESESFRDLNFNADPSSLNQDPSIPPPPLNSADLVKQAWPGFETGIILKWNELIPPKKAFRKDKKPTRKPKPLITSKLSLELAADQDKLFRVPGPASTTYKQHLLECEARGLVSCRKSDADEEEESNKKTLEVTFDDDAEAVGGFTLQDIDMVCHDWGYHVDQVEVEYEQKVQAHLAAESQATGKRKVEDADAGSDDEWDDIFLKKEDGQDAPQPRKKVRLPIEAGLPRISRFTAPSFDSFEDMTKRGAKRVILDMNDPYLLLEETETHRPKRQRIEQKLVRMTNGESRPDIFQRFNLSNDDAYEALKENHQHKVRATLGNLAVEHSMPALRLSWPFYKVKLDLRNGKFHRPEYKFGKQANQTIRFDKLAFHKRKTKKGKAVEVFRTTKDLGITDNSTAVLFEYCERRPPVLSNFGMGNRVINYYRKKKVDDEESPPKMDIGESHVLHPEDRSPFAIFGEVSPGETLPTLHNQMYRAPIFKQQARPTDFLCIRSSTGVEGSKFYLHNIDHLYVVGQTFPSVEIPGPHSRKVTNASKNRIKMISYRMMRRNAEKVVNLSDITKHIADSTDTQNRQKLKEFLVSAKREKGQWTLKEGEVLMDENQIRQMIKAEDVCLIDGMQLGMQMLEDAGFDPDNVDLEEEEEEGGDEETPKASKKKEKKDDKAEDKSLDRMAPWKTSKAFIDACAGKAMLKLHGEGDPTGHGLGFSFIRTSMKGGYIETVQKGGSHTTAADAMAAHPDALRKMYNGHAYNVKEQETMYKKGIKQIWDKQKATLSDRTEQDDSVVVPQQADEDDRFNTQASQTPAHVDEGASQITGMTTGSRTNRKRLRITRDYPTDDGGIEQRIEIVEDPVIIDKYIKQRKELEIENINIYEGRPTGEVGTDRRTLLEIEKELERLNRNKARRQARESQKGVRHKTTAGAGSPEPDKAAAGTTRKCNNCGQVGHIKTNKKTKKAPSAGRKRKRPAGGDNADEPGVMMEGFTGLPWKFLGSKLRKKARPAQGQHQAEKPKAAPRKRKPKETKAPDASREPREPKESDVSEDAPQAVEPTGAEDHPSLDNNEAAVQEKPAAKAPRVRAPRGPRPPRVRKPKPPKPPKPPLPPRPRLKHSEIPLARTIIKGMPKKPMTTAKPAQAKRTTLLSFNRKDTPANQDTPDVPPPSVQIGNLNPGQLAAIGMNLGNTTKSQPQDRPFGIFRRNNNLGKHWGRPGEI